MSRKILFTLIASLFLSFSINYSVYAALVGEWHFGEGNGVTTSDSSDYNNIGTLVNDPIWVNGKIGSALQFDGFNTYVSVNDSYSLDISSAITLEAWVKSDVNTTDPATRRIIEKESYSLSASNQAYFKIYVGTVSIGVGYPWTSSDVGVWHHLVGTYNSETRIIRLYQDGVAVASTLVTLPVSNIATNNSNLIIGASGTTSNRFDGIIDEVKIYNHALTEAEILQKYQESVSVTDFTAPATISLYTGTATVNSITLTWTATGDDGTTGTATSYDVRYLAGTSINIYNWFTAIQASGEPTPQVNGGAETFTINGLNPNTLYYFAIKSVDEAQNLSNISNSPSATTLSATPASDIVSPASVSNLTVEMSQGPELKGTSSDWVATLTWTAVGDDGTTGTATSYDIRYIINTPITSSNWASATQVNGEPVPKTNGGAETLTVNNLSEGDTYYFAIKVIDEASNQSNLSNVTTGNAPWITIMPRDGQEVQGAGQVSPPDVFIYASEAKRVDLYIDGNLKASIERAQFIGGLNGNACGWTWNTTQYANGIHTLRVVVVDYLDKLFYLQTTATVNNVIANNLTSNSVTLNWLAVPSHPYPSDYPYPVILSYDIRYMAGTPITYENFDSAIQVSGEPTPGVVYSTETFTINGLNPNTHYYFVVKITDAGNYDYHYVDFTTPFETPPAPDTTEPATINTLTLNSITQNSITLNWTSVGDDGTTGTATNYDIRYSNTLITESNWATATQVTGEPTPALAGNSQSMTINGLSANTVYYFAIKVNDEVPNTSGLSNVATGTTSSVPEADNPPEITIASPYNGEVNVNGTRRVVLRVADDKGISKVEVYFDNTLIKTLTAALSEETWGFDLDTTKYSNDSHKLRAIVTDSTNQKAQAESTFKTFNGNVTISTAPVVGVGVVANIHPRETILNPAKGGKSSISYTVGDKAANGGMVHVTIEIFNANGDLIKTLIDMDMEAGTYQSVWEGKNFDEEVVASGVYIARLRAGKYTASKKMVVIK